MVGARKHPDASDPQAFCPAGRHRVASPATISAALPLLAWPGPPRQPAIQRDRVEFEMGTPRYVSRPAPTGGDDAQGKRPGNRLNKEVDMGNIGFVALLVGALAIAVGMQFLGRARSREEWGITTVAAFLGGFAGGELFDAASQWGPSLDGLFVLPALIGALAIAGLAAYGQRVTGRRAT
jgi:hypothetical protein